MISRKFRSASLVVAILILAGLFLGTFSTRGAAVTPPPVQLATANQTGATEFVSSIQAPGWTASSRPWTKEEMLAAKPYPRQTVGNTEAIDISPAGPTGKPGFQAGALSMDAQAPAVEVGEPDVFSAAAPLGYSYPAPFTRYRNLYSYLLYPNITVGKMFFTQNGFNYVCSAASIGNYAIWTAGHCVHDGGGDQFTGWSSNVVFVPAYLAGSAPRGQWHDFEVWTTGAWVNGDFRYDYGGVILQTIAGNTISDVVGNLGFAWNQSRNLHWFLMGYPAEAPFNGQYNQVCAASYAYNYTGLGTPYPTGVGCDLTGGSSGGPWIYKFSGSAGASNYLNGENSFGRVGFPKEMFTPFFDTATRNFHLHLLSRTAP